MRTHTKVFWGWWAALMLLATAWALSNPLMAAPDEPAHVMKAAAVVRGQLLGPETARGTQVEVPYLYALTQAYPSCYMFTPDETGVCDPAPGAELDVPSRTATPAGRYNPLYYAVVGLPTLLPPSDAVLYSMRLVSAALCTFLLALGLRALAEAGRPAWVVPGVAAALTPMVVFLTSTVNPAAIEIAAAFALWCQLLTLLRHPDPQLTARRMAWLAVSATFLVNARGLSLLYCAVIVVVALLLSQRSAFLDVVRERRTWPSFAVIVVACLAAAGWVVGTNSLGSGGAELHPELGFRAAAEITVLDWDRYVVNMVGQFGWMDTTLPSWVLMTFAAAAGTVVVLAVAVGSWRERCAMALVLAATFVLPVVIHASQARYLGIIWQGRYILPVAIGLPVVAGFVLLRRAQGLPPALTAPAQAVGVAIATVVGALLALTQLAAFATNLHRYVNGADRGWLTLEPDAWLPPVSLPGAIALGLLASALFGAVIAWTARLPASSPVGIAPGAPDLEPDAAGSTGPVGSTDPAAPGHVSRDAAGLLGR